MAWGAIIAAAVSAYGSSQANKKGKKKTKLEEQALMQQMELARRQGEISEEQYQFWLDNYRPLALEAISEARRDVIPDYAAITADNAGAYNAQRGGMTRAAQRAGMNPADGAFGASLARIGGDEAKSLVFNRNRAREGAKGQKLSNLMGAYGMGSGMPGLAAQTAASAGGGFGNAASAYGAGAQSAYSMAQQDAAGWGNLVSSIPWGQLFNSGGAAGGTSTPPNSVGPTAGGYSYPAPAGGQPGPWAGGYNYTSSREAKHDITPVDPDAALDVVNQTPVASYAYNGTEQPMIGTIAEEAPGAISNGKQVNALNQIGALTGAVQAISKRLGAGNPKQVSAASTGAAPRAKNRPAAAGAPPRRGIGTRFMDRLVPDRNNDGRRSGGEWGRAIGEGALNYATGGMYGMGRNVVDWFRGRGDRLVPGVEGPVPTYRGAPGSMEHNYYMRGQDNRAFGREALGSTAAAVRRANAANNGNTNFRAGAYGDQFVGMMSQLGDQARTVVDQWRERNVQ